MDVVRPLQGDDIPDVVKLFRSAFQQNGNHAAGELESYFHRAFFENPWQDDELHSWVHVTHNGVLDGFVGVQPKRLQFRRRALRAITATKLMVAPTAAPLVASRLLRRVFAGPQELLYSDISNDAGRRIFESLGASTIMLYSLKWQRPLRPVRHALAWLGAPRLRPIASLADAVLGRSGPLRVPAVPDGFATADLPLDVIATRLPDLVGDRLRPAYDVPWLQWLLQLTPQMLPAAVVRQRLVRDPHQQPVGWFLYSVSPNGLGDVLQIAARKDASAAVFDCLLADAWSAGVTMLSGRLEPGMIAEMSARHCLFRRADHWTIVQTRNPEILATIAAGDAFLSRLEGEW